MGTASLAGTGGYGPGLLSMSPSTVKFLTQLWELLEHFGIDYKVSMPHGFSVLVGSQDRKQESAVHSRVSERAALVREEALEEEADGAASCRS